MKKILLFLIAFGAFIACKNSGELSKTPDPKTNYYIDVHHLGKGNVTAQAVAAAHKKDLQTEGKYGVQFIKYWVDENSGTVYCLSKSPDKQEIVKTHAEAHGLIPQEIHRVSPGEAAKITGNSKLFLDTHYLGSGNVTPEAVAKAHEQDLKVESKYGVNFINYWVDDSAGIVYCLSEAPDSSAIANCHKEAHGLLPDRVEEIVQGE